MTYRKSKMRDGRTSRADKQPDLKWVVEYLVQREGQRKTASLLGVNRKDGGVGAEPGAADGEDGPWPCSGSWPA